MENQETNFDEILLHQRRQYFRDYVKTYFQLNKEKVLKYRQEYLNQKSFAFLVELQLNTNKNL